MDRQRAAAADDPDGATDDVVDLRGVEQAVVRRDGRGGMFGGELPEELFIQHVTSPLHIRLICSMAGQSSGFSALGFCPGAGFFSALPLAFGALREAEAGT